MEGLKRERDEWFEELVLDAQSGDAEAQYQLAMCYVDGDGVEEDDEEAARWLAAACALGHVDAMCELATFHEDGLGGLEVDKREATRLWAAAAALGHAPSQYNLALRYQQGDGVPRDACEAARLLQAAAVQGDMDAQHGLAMCYEMGRGVERDTLAAVRLHGAAAEQGLEESQRRLVWHFADHCDLRVIFVVGRMRIVPLGCESRVATAQRVYHESSQHARRAALCWMWAGLLRPHGDVMRIIGRDVYESRSEPALWM